MIKFQFHLILPLLVFTTIIGCSDNNNPANEIQNPEILIRDTAITEANIPITLAFPVLLSTSTEENVIINYQINDGTAEGGKDYLADENGQLIFLPGETTKNIEIQISGEQFIEEDEHFTINLIEAANADIIKSEAIVLIRNDDEDNSNAGVLVIPETGYTTPESYDGMTLVWQDEFSGTELNEDNWKHDLGDGCPNLCGWGNGELEYYRKENTSIVEGNLVIEAKKESVGGKFYTSSKVITQGLKSFKYGRIDIRAVMPFGQGMWPALWMLGSNITQVGWPKCGEIDIMEMIGGNDRENEVHGTIHWDSGGNHAQYGSGYTLGDGIFADEYHVFSIVWDDSKIEWYVDDIKYNEADIEPGDLNEFHEEFYFIFNIAVGGSWPGSPNISTVFPQYMVVDYVRVFQPN